MSDDSGKNAKKSKLDTPLNLIALAFTTIAAGVGLLQAYFSAQGLSRNFELCASFEPLDILLLLYPAATRHCGQSEPVVSNWTILNRLRTEHRNICRV
jgi:hypothetical protein